MLETNKHIPVLLDETINSLNIKPNGIYLDATFGNGGHSKLILSKLNRKGRLLAIDCDPESIKLSKNITDSRFTIFYGKFSRIIENLCLSDLNGKINGILLDLGISSSQLNNPKRGFSFMKDGPLDMRMNNTIGKSAANWLYQASFKNIYWVLKTFGEEKFAKRISLAIINYKKNNRINTTMELASIISQSIPFYEKNKHPATRSFQAIRIFINKELEELEKSLMNIIKILSYKGRLSIISFNSLESKIVKYFMNQYKTDAIFNKNDDFQGKLLMLGKIFPSKKEILHNKCARSAILRFAEKIK